jgi:hypothetical protein
MNELTAYFSSRIGHARDMAMRAMPGPMLVRLAVWFWAVVALGLAMPEELVTSLRGALVLLVIGLLPALLPRTRMVSLMLFTAVVGWLATTAAFEEPIATWRLVALAGALYLVHTSAALAAVLPYDTVTSPGVLAGWLLRALGVVALAVPFGALAVAGSGLFGGRTFLVAAIAGAGVVCVLGWLVARLVK